VAQNGINKTIKKKNLKKCYDECVNEIEYMKNNDIK
jgi:hypothetical protein